MTEPKQVLSYLDEVAALIQSARHGAHVAALIQSARHGAHVAALIQSARHGAHVAKVGGMT